ncbi:hypothetical protein L3Q82_001575 [Scortum barcoo]|uniref:Uncharacterized protein n=1 Tax=Scortum barcoo TaxID=214431 RepID=A0ACB8W847_9TELE|nr:hypothetical protein L3Q82_001575 [Scortum barcoo]
MTSSVSAVCVEPLSACTGEHPEGTDIDTVKSYKYLGVHLNDSLDWTHNTDSLVKKGNSRLFLLRRLRSFGVQGLSSGPFMTLWWHQPSFMG